MRLTLCAVGRLKAGPMRQLVDEYTKRLAWRLTIKEIEAKTPATEAHQLLEAIPADTYCIALDETGEELTSPQFANLLQSIQSHHNSKVCFLIGGADGLADEVKARAQKTISFGRTTWPHMMVRVMLCEQIYRGQQILKGHPYHRG